MKQYVKMALGILFAQTLLIVGLNFIPAFSQNSASIQKQGLQTKTLLQQVDLVRSSELNGKYQLQLVESIFEPGGYLGEHHHAGPGIRYVTFGEITSVSAGKSKVFKAGDSFYDSGDTVHELYNKTNKMVRVLNFEVLPSGWKGASAIPVRH
jgi:quercetin dioxygenase-like cupin family protein